MKKHLPLALTGALALAASSVSFALPAGLTVYDGFDYAAGPLAANTAGSVPGSAANSFGWLSNTQDDGTSGSGTWYGNGGLNFRGNSGASIFAGHTWNVPAGYQFVYGAPVGNTAGNNTANANVAHRGLAEANRIDMAADGTVFFSFLYQHASAGNLNFTFKPLNLGGEAIQIIGLQASTGGALGITSGGGTAGNPGSVVASEPGVFLDGSQYLIVGRLTSSAVGNDNLSLAVYGSSATVPSENPVWLLSHDFSSTQVISVIGLSTGNAALPPGSGNAGGHRWDELRIGTTWDAAVIPEPSTYAMTFGLVALAGAVYLRRRRS